MIIASEMAQEAFTTEEGQKLRTMINDRLDDFISEADETD